MVDTGRERCMTTKLAASLGISVSTKPPTEVFLATAMLKNDNLAGLVEFFRYVFRLTHSRNSFDRALSFASCSAVQQ